MKQTKEVNTFESKINKTFIRYGRIPFALLIAVLVIVISYEQFYQTFILTSITQKEVVVALKEYESEVESYLSLLESYGNKSDAFENPQTNQSLFYELFYQFQSSSSMGSQIVIYDEQGKVVFITRPSVEGSVYNSTFNHIFTNRYQKTDKIVIGSTRAESMSPRMNTLLMGQRIENDAGTALDVLIYVEPNSLNNLIQHKRVHQMVITDRFGYVIATTSSSLVGPLSRFNESGASRVTVDGSSYRVRSRLTSDGMLNVETLMLNKTLWEEYGALILFMAATIYFMQKANKKVAQRVGKETSESIRALMDAVHKIKSGDLDSTVVLNTNDELELLGEEFNAMSKKIKELMYHNEMLVELRKDAQIKQLEAQFNPHFLYNSLETIRYLITYDSETATRLILNITKLLRYSIENSSNEVFFGDDLEYVELYLDINKVRLGDRFSYVIDVSDEVKTLLIPRLLIQPLIENSIKHGYREKESLKIRIIGTSDDENIYIEVADDGSGMSPSVLSRVESASRTQEREDGSYGIHSIIKRLNLIYGPKSRMDITSGEDGTHIILTIPKGGNHV